MLEEIPFEEETFDLVYIRSTIRFVNSNSWKGLFKEINKVLKKGGWMEIVDSDINTNRSGPKWNAIGEAWNAVQLANNINPDAFKHLDKTIKDCGFAVSNVKKFSTPIGNWGGMLGEFVINTCKRWFMLVSDILMEKLKLETREEYDKFIESVETEVNEYQTHYKASRKKISSISRDSFDPIDSIDLFDQIINS
ncbi:2751_t:CDS:2 [Entrophospora sp. SA101]|nr:2751_t:CDS:2 [Entrophospora sp. SA101]